MKRLSIKQKRRLIRLSLKREKRYKNRSAKHTSDNWILLPVPEQIGMHPKHVGLLTSLIERLYEKASGNSVRIRLDFSKTAKMYSDGTLYLLACLSDFHSRFTRCRLSMIPPTDTIVEQVLHQTGIAALLGRRKQFDSDKFHRSVRYWYTAHGNNVNLENAKDIFNSFEGSLTPELSRSIYKGVSEAMTNCAHHAYEGLNLEISCKKWWMFSREDKANGELQVVFCDLGIGIPKSLFRESEDVADDWLSRLKNFLAQHMAGGKADDDALKIKAAIEIGRTRTKLQHRGKGLKQMVSTLDEIGGGKAFVEIISGNGLFRHVTRNKKSVEKGLPLSHNKKTSVRGTMIHWSIPLPNHEDAS